LKNVKNYFIEAKIDKLTESVIPQQSLFQHQLGYVWLTISGVRRKLPRGAKLRHNLLTSQINFRGSAEGTTILGGSGGMSPGRFCKITPKNTHFCAFWKHVLV